MTAIAITGTTGTITGTTVTITNTDAGPPCLLLSVKPE